jgi:hypothetical protein
VLLTFFVVLFAFSGILKRRQPSFHPWCVSLNTICLFLSWSSDNLLRLLRCPPCPPPSPAFPRNPPPSLLFSPFRSHSMRLSLPGFRGGWTAEGAASPAPLAASPLASSCLSLPPPASFPPSAPSSSLTSRRRPSDSVRLSVRPPFCSLPSSVPVRPSATSKSCGYDDRVE